MKGSERSYFHFLDLGHEKFSKSLDLRFVVHEEERIFALGPS